ncbi:MAG: sodium-dependent bicarbonate transport family permease, partial [Verrucomicrobiota bacterium]
MELLIDNLISPVVLAFALGIIAKLVRSDLEIPSAIYQALSIYLLFAIGLKGGVALAETPVREVLLPAGVTIVLGLVTPFIAYFALRWFGRLEKLDAGATAAHYGSVSAVTFLAALEAAKNSGLEPDGYLPALVAILEVPGILVGLLLAQSGPRGGLGAAVREVVTGKSMFLLNGGMEVGAWCGPANVAGVAPFFIDPLKWG